MGVEALEDRRMLVVTIEYLVLGTFLELASQSRRFDFQTPGSTIQAPPPGDPIPYQPVVPTDVYSAGVGFGWDAPLVSQGSLSAGGFQRAVPAGPEGDLRRDGNFGMAPHVFQVDLLPDTSYEVTLTVGDIYARDQMSVTVPTGYGNIESGGASVTNMATPAGGFIHPTFVAKTNAAGQLQLRFADGGGDPFWLINGIDIRRLASPLAITRVSPGADPLPADGHTVDMFHVVGAIPGEAYDIAVDGGVLVTPDQVPGYVGAQIVAPADNFDFQVRREVDAGNATLLVEHVTGQQRGLLAQSFAAPSLLQFDFNGAGSDTQSGYLGVHATDLFAGGPGFGWVTAPREFQRGTTGYSATSVSLFRDGAWEYGARAFQVDVTPGGVYDLRFYAGDRGFARDKITIEVEGVAQTINAVAANSFSTLEFLDIADDGDGVLNIVFSDTGGDPAWVVNGFDLAASTGTGSQLPGAAPELAELSGAGASPIGAAELASAKSEAIAWWQGQGATASELARLAATPVALAQLGAGVLGQAFTLHVPSVLIDDNGAGLGWAASGGAAGRYDLATVVAHELGHVLGLPDRDDADGLMSGTLAVGLQRVSAGAGGQPCGSPLDSDRALSRTDGADAIFARLGQLSESGQAASIISLLAGPAPAERRADLGARRARRAEWESPESELLAEDGDTQG